MSELPKGIEAFIAAQRAAALGRYVCRGPCGREGDINKAVQIRWGDAIVFAICPECLLDRELGVFRDEQGIHAQIRKKGLILPVSL